MAPASVGVAHAPVSFANWLPAPGPAELAAALRQDRARSGPPSSGFLAKAVLPTPHLFISFPSCLFTAPPSSSRSSCLFTPTLKHWGSLRIYLAIFIPKFSPPVGRSHTLMGSALTKVNSPLPRGRPGPGAAQGGRWAPPGLWAGGQVWGWQRSFHLGKAAVR